MQIIKGDLIQAALSGKEQVIGHQTNCMGRMGSGIAVSIKKNFPEACEAYMCSTLVLGDYSSATTKGVRVINLQGQYRYGTERRHTNYDALKESLEKAIEELDLTRLALPYNIGCGLAGGDWDVVRYLLEKVEIKTGCEVVLYHLENPYNK